MDIRSHSPETLPGAPLVAGIDEAGRGPLAGPVVAAAVVLCHPVPDGLADSKALPRGRRSALDLTIRDCCAWAVGVVDVEIIDRVNIFGATMLAMTQAMDRLCLIMGERGCGEPDRALIDGNFTPAGRVREWRWAAQPIVGGDAIEPAISAASIIAKEYRDRLMRAAAAQHPDYGWDRNMGYGTREHLAALRQHGPSPLHRMSFTPCAQTEMLK